MAVKCPYCGSKKTQTTNLGQRVLAWGATAVTYAVLAPFTRAGAQGPARAAGRNICPTSEYICLNCKREFTGGPDM